MYPRPPDSSTHPGSLASVWGSKAITRPEGTPPKEERPRAKSLDAARLDAACALHSRSMRDEAASVPWLGSRPESKRSVLKRRATNPRCRPVRNSTVETAPGFHRVEAFAKKLRTDPIRKGKIARRYTVYE